MIYIGYDTFNGCSKLTSLHIPNSVDSIGENAFHNCNKLDSIFCEGITPPKAPNGAFEDNTLKGSLFVPKGSKKAYEAVDPWRNFWNIEEVTSGGINISTCHNDITVKVQNGTITVCGAGYDTVVEIVDVSGNVVYTGQETTIEGLYSGLYIVKVGTKVTKVLI